MVTVYDIVQNTSSDFKKYLDKTSLDAEQKLYSHIFFDGVVGNRVYGDWEGDAMLNLLDWGWESDAKKVINFTKRRSKDQLRKIVSYIADLEQHEGSKIGWIVPGLEELLEDHPELPILLPEYEMLSKATPSYLYTDVLNTKRRSREILKLLEYLKDYVPRNCREGMSNVIFKSERTAKEILNLGHAINELPSEPGGTKKAPSLVRDETLKWAIRSKRPLPEIFQLFEVYKHGGNCDFTHFFDAMDYYKKPINEVIALLNSDTYNGLKTERPDKARNIFSEMLKA